ncbi:hypothetical protein Pst134EA_007750 [Puccinia striiformis f. sp. tritici]|uniref:hypothetical protein n=1 Tax=Puccinia striiformis f. sp. tritici TaxID=168172 RepID=UPI002007510C|nr:hypothetical protein Pst134EA_007750 [Puccinia striiformis f. sp. tritici]KAH9470498.1 hypothetical protein Pst134EA_007750 [Puccinia striiformis f. sp. tritici]
MAVPNYYGSLIAPIRSHLDGWRDSDGVQEGFPDRSPNLSEAERRLAPENFQKVADAYYVLSNKNRRRGVRRDLRTQQTQSNSTDGQSNNAFEDLLQPEIDRTGETKTTKWKYLGAAASGGTLGFIVGNLPGLAIGSLAGNRLGAIRDAKGKSVCEVFSSLESNHKTLIIKALALKVLGTP